MDCGAGENDFLKEQGMALLESFVDPVVIYHSKGHTIPRIGEFFLSLIKLMVLISHFIASICNKTL